MARKKKAAEPCEFCEGDSYGSPDTLPNAEIYFESYPDNGSMCVTIYSFSDDREQNGEMSYQIPFHYCPQCGRKLGW